MACHEMPVVTGILDQKDNVEDWLRERWKDSPAPLTCSVDLRDAGFKLAPVDTNLFPSGFNNLNPEARVRCTESARAVLQQQLPDCQRIVIVPENHTRNPYYLESLNVLQNIFRDAGYAVRIGYVNGEGEETAADELLQRNGARVGFSDFNPCLVLLNNDLSSGIPKMLQHLEQHVYPPVHLGWDFRLKSDHFRFYTEVIGEFAKAINLDPWLMDPLFSAVDGVDFMSQTGVEQLAAEVDRLFVQIRAKYQEYGIKETPFVAVKADNGTYGMSVMMVHDGEELLKLNRKQRTRMATSKGNRKVTRVMVQEGVFSQEILADGAVAEPVVYLIGERATGQFYRVHQSRGANENLNSPGMYFEPKISERPCDEERVYVYSVIARLAALAAAYEMKRSS